MAPLWVLTKHTYLPGVAYELSWTTLEVTEVTHSKGSRLKSQIARFPNHSQFIFNITSQISKIHLSLWNADNKRWDLSDVFFNDGFFGSENWQQFHDPTLRTRRDQQPVGWLVVRRACAMDFCWVNSSRLNEFQLSNEKSNWLFRVYWGLYCRVMYRNYSIP